MPNSRVHFSSTECYHYISTYVCVFCPLYQNFAKNNSTPFELLLRQEDKYYNFTDIMRKMKIINRKFCTASKGPIIWLLFINSCLPKLEADTQANPQSQKSKCLQICNYLAVDYGFLVRKACVKYTPVLCTKALFFGNMFDFRNKFEILRHDTVLVLGKSYIFKDMKKPLGFYKN